MILILLSWLYITFTCINVGVGFGMLLKSDTKNFVLNALMGLFGVTLIASGWAFFGRINIEFHLFLLLVNAGLILGLNRKIAAVYLLFVRQVSGLALSLKILLAVNALLILAQCASSPYFIDNETYYIQAIKWLNEYGFVKGLPNVHFFLAQCSGWHITQSAFNFSFLYKHFNDLSGYCLLLGNAFAVLKLQQYFTHNSRIALIAGLLPMANVVLFQFISTPSPDLPVYIITFIVFSYFLEHYAHFTTQGFMIVVALVLYGLFIKVIAVALCLIPLVLLIKHYKRLYGILPHAIVLGLVTVALWMGKNYIISGFPLFPSTIIDPKNAAWKIPPSITKLYADELKLYSFYVTKETYDRLNAWQLFMRWLTLPKADGIFNKLTTAVTILSPFFIYRFKNRQRYTILYFVFLLSVVLLFATSPQYRFFMGYTLFFGQLIVEGVISNKRVITAVLALSVAVTAFTVLVPFSLTSKSRLTRSTFSVNNAMVPHKNSRLPYSFYKTQMDGFEYYAPADTTYFWASGDGPLPCINKNQVQYFKSKFGLVPKMMGKEPGDGFYSAPVQKE